MLQMTTELQICKQYCDLNFNTNFLTESLLKRLGLDPIIYV